MEFASVDLVRTAVKEYFIFIDREYIYVQNTSEKIRIKCKAEECLWVLYADINRVDNKTFRVNTLKDKHDCGLVFSIKYIDST